MLSLHTNNAALSAQNSISHTQGRLSTSMTRLSTGYRINSAMDDAAGLQISTRLTAQTSGMAVAMRNTQNSISMMQTAEGALAETTNLLMRMKDLATQAADASSTTKDLDAMQAEYDTLTSELSNVLGNTTFGGTKLMTDTSGKLSSAGGVNFQIGDSTSQTMLVDLSTSMATMHAAILTGSAGYSSAGTAVAAAGTDLTAAGGASSKIDALQTAIESVGTVRSALGAASNRLDHVYNNLSNISTNTKAAAGRIIDVDFAVESSSMTSSQMLMQAGTAMLKQSNSISSLVMSLLQ
ncbi:MAG: flagellin [Pseudomonadota bacterium]